jgi:hypothetical protein
MGGVSGTLIVSTVWSAKITVQAVARKLCFSRRFVRLFACSGLRVSNAARKLVQLGWHSRGRGNLHFASSLRPSRRQARTHLLQASRLRALDVR